MCKAAKLQKLAQWEINFNAGLIFTMSIVGIFLNLLSSGVLYKHHVFRNPFGRLTLVHALANIGVLIIFAFWVVPLILFDINEDIEWLNRQMGQLILMFQEIGLHAIFFISVNRFSCVCNPSSYRKWFTNKLTTCIIIFIIILCIVYYFSYYINGCGIHFEHESIVWEFLATPCGLFMAFYMDFCYNMVLFGCVGLLDLSSLIMLRLNRQQFNASLGQAAVRRRNKRDMRFFVQAIINSIVYGFTLFTFDVLTCHLEGMTGVFYAGTFAWCSAHLISGIILVTFNQEIRRVLTSPRSVFNRTEVNEVSQAVSQGSQLTVKSKKTTITKSKKSMPTVQ